MGLSLLVAGHHHTEAPVLDVLLDLLDELLPDVEVCTMDSNPAQTVLGM
jgi:putative NIF3 family GTP cyclohydrolase 1 type 2